MGTVGFLSSFPILCFISSSEGDGVIDVVGNTREEEDEDREESTDGEEESWKKIMQN